MIQQAFIQVRLGLLIDRSRDYEIKIKDFPDIQVGNQREQQSREASKGGDIQSNLILEEVEALASSILADDNDDIIDFEETIVVDADIQEQLHLLD